MWLHAIFLAEGRVGLKPLASPFPLKRKPAIFLAEGRVGLKRRGLGAVRRALPAIFLAEGRVGLKLAVSTRQHRIVSGDIPGRGSGWIETVPRR